MSRSLGNTIADSLALSLGYAERLLVGIPAERFARFATPGRKTIESNHPAFVYGHLSLYGGRILDHLGLDSSSVQPSEQFQKCFSKDAKCVDDPTGTLYPPMEEIRERFLAGYQAALAALRDASDEALQKPNPMPGPMAEKFPTIGSIHAFYTGGHIMMHLGQISAWRRMEGMAPA